MWPLAMWFLHYYLFLVMPSKNPDETSIWVALVNLQTITCNLYMAIMCGLYKHLCISLLEIHLMCDSCKLMANIILFHLCCCYVMLTVCVCFCSHFIVIYIQFHICRRHLICLVLLSRHQLPQLLQKVLFLWMPYMSQSHLVALSRRQLQRLL